MSWLRARWQEASTLNGVAGIAVILLIMLSLAFFARVFGVSIADVFNDALNATGALTLLIVAAVGLAARVKQVVTPEPTPLERQATIEYVKQALEETKADSNAN